MVVSIGVLNHRRIQSMVHKILLHLMSLYVFVFQVSGPHAYGNSHMLYYRNLPNISDVLNVGTKKMSGNVRKVPWRRRTYSVVC